MKDRDLISKTINRLFISSDERDWDSVHHQVCNYIVTLQSAEVDVFCYGPVTGGRFLA